MASAAVGSGPILIEVLANDSDADADVLVVTAVAPALHGSTAIAGARISYTPADDYTGEDVFSYSVGDGRGGSASASVSVSVAPGPNRAPIVVDDDASTPFGMPVTLNLLANDSDPDGDVLRLATVGQPGNGRVQFDPDGRLTYTPQSGFSGVDRFSYQVEDARGAMVGGRVTVTVMAPPNQLPIARDDSVVTLMGMAVSVNVLANDADPDGDPVQLVAVGLPGNGSVSFNASGEVTYTPNPQFIGDDSFSYRIEDGRGGSASAMLRINVQGVPNQPNQAPIARNDEVLVQQDGQVSFNVLANDSDPDGDPLQLISVSQPAQGSVSFDAGGNVTYVSSPNFTGDTFSYTISDGRGGSASGTVTVRPDMGVGI